MIFAGNICNYYISSKEHKSTSIKRYVQTLDLCVDSNGEHVILNIKKIHL